MLFNTWTFAAFFAVVCAAYFPLRRNLRAQNVLLLLASYVFYGWWDWRFLTLIWISTAVDFVVARSMSRTDDKRRKALLLTSVFVNLGILGFFKYFGFFVESAEELLRGIGLDPHLPILHVVLPVGISFYTFQTMAYTIDVYRRRLEPTTDWLVFGLYVCYFPQLVAGPIERAQQLLPQFAKPRKWDLDRASSGALLILIGLVRKVVIADMAAGEVNAAFSNPGQFGAIELLRAVALFSFQIYGDFAGYSDIARGTSRILGIELMENFNHPYFARNITDFWRRWHISLSSWLRDYLYIPLGGSRGSSVATYRNLALTMLLGGLWHGAAWTFVVWGGIHGLALAVHKLFLRGRDPLQRLTGALPIRVLKWTAAWALTMAVVALAWVFFRADSFSNAFEVLSGIASGRGYFWIRQLYLPLGLLVLMLIVDLPQAWTGSHEAMLRWPWPIRGLTYATLIMILVLFGNSGDDVPFIYFQF